jgi:hypothetical protein
MLKISPEFRIYDYSLSKAVSGLIRAGFISISYSEWSDIIDKSSKAKLLKRRKGAQCTLEWKDMVDKILEAKLLKYHKVIPVSYSEYSRYIIDGTGDNTPLTYAEICAKYNKLLNSFVAICHKNENGTLELTGFVY